MGKQEGMGTVEYPQVKFKGFFHLGYVRIQPADLINNFYICDFEWYNAVHANLAITIVYVVLMIMWN